MADKPKYKKSGNTPYGSVGQLNQAATLATSVPATGPAPTTTPPVPAQGPPLDLTPKDEIEAALFGPTRLPDQPVTAGAPFGPGPMGVPPLDDEERVRTFVRGLADAPDSSEEMRSFAARLERGE